MTLADGTVVTIRPDDAKIESEFVHNLSHESQYFRFMDSLRELTPRMVSHLTEIDYDRHMAPIVVALSNGAQTEIAVARYATTDTAGCREFATAVVDAWHNKGIGTLLLRRLMDAARERRLCVMFGEVLAANHNMLNFVNRLGLAADFDRLNRRVVRIDAQL